MSPKVAPFRVEKAGAPRAGYGRGWFAFNNATGVGQFFPTWRQAMNYALRQHRIAEIRDMNTKAATARREKAGIYVH